MKTCSKCQLKKACHYTNLKPMWFSDNSAKGNKYKEEQYADQ